MMIGKCFRESSNFNWMKPRQFTAGRFELNRRRIRGEVTDVGPVQYFNRFARAHETRGRKASI
jgi:hypothetical protein